MLDKIKAGMTTVAGLVMRCLAIGGVRVETFAFFENWRRPSECKCLGCQKWDQVKEGLTTVESVGQKALLCEHRYLAWKAKSLIHAHLDPVRGFAWILVIAASFHNLLNSIGILAIVTTAGKNDLLTQYFKGSNYTATWFISLVDGGSPPTYAAGDTMGSHAGWSENVGYSNANRLTWTGGTASGGSIDNSLSPAAFNINAPGTIAGSFMVTSNTKSGTSGILYSGSNFTQGNRSVVGGDTLNCTTTETAA